MLSDNFVSIDNKFTMPRKKGAGFIVFEGLDGSGQSTQAGLLKNFLSKRGFKIILTKEPTGNSQVGKKIEKILNKKEKISPNKLQELFAQDRREHLKKVIIPALKSGKIVISDRYFFSSFAYGKASGLDLNWLIKLNDKFLLPDLTIILKTRPTICVKRIQKRNKKRTLFEEKEKLAKVWKIYKILPKMFPNVILIEGEKSIKEVFVLVKKIVLSKFGER